jgi:hypothetical protein
MTFRLKEVPFHEDASPWDFVDAPRNTEYETEFRGDYAGFADDPTYEIASLGPW